MKMEITHVPTPELKPWDLKLGEVGKMLNGRHAGNHIMRIYTGYVELESGRTWTAWTATDGAHPFAGPGWRGPDFNLEPVAFDPKLGVDAIEGTGFTTMAKMRPGDIGEICDDRTPQIDLVLRIYAQCVSLVNPEYTWDVAQANLRVKLLPPGSKIVLTTEN